MNMGEPKQGLFWSSQILELSKFQTFVNKSFTATLNIAVINSKWKMEIFFEAKEFSHINCETEMTGSNV